MRAAALIALIMLIGCSSSDDASSPAPASTSQASCDYRPGSASCLDYRNTDANDLQTLEGVCASAPSGKATYTAGALCNTSDALGGCQSTDASGAMKTTWYFPPAVAGGSLSTEDDVKRHCGTSQTFIGHSF